MAKEPFDLDDPEANPIVDDGTFSKLATIIGSGPDGIESLVDTFAQTAPETVQAMRSAAEDDDMEAYSNAAHKLKGEAGTFGARRLQAMCKRLEVDAREGRVEEPREKADLVGALLGKTVKELESRV